MSAEHTHLADCAAALARDVEPPLLARATADEMVRRAALSADSVRIAERRAKLPMLVATACSLAVAAGLSIAFGLRGSAPETVSATAATDAGAPLTELVLPAGDRVRSTPGSLFEVPSADERSSRVVIRRGELLFDVVSLADGRTFDVDAGSLHVRVHGTIFSVHSADDGTRVRVFEGVVSVERGGRARALVAGETFIVGRPGEDARVVAAGERAARARADAARARREQELVPDHRASESARREQEPARLAESSGVETETATHMEPGSGPGAATPPAAPTPAAARRFIARGEPDRALALAEPRSGPEWTLVRGDALRALRRFDEAADAYDRAVPELAVTERPGAGYRAARCVSSRSATPRGRSRLSMRAAPTRWAPRSRSARSACASTLCLVSDERNRGSAPHRCTRHAFRTAR